MRGPGLAPGGGCWPGGGRASTPRPQSHGGAIPGAGFCIGNPGLWLCCAVTPVASKSPCLLVVTRHHLPGERQPGRAPHGCRAPRLPHGCPCFGPQLGPGCWGRGRWGRQLARAGLEAVACEILQTKVLSLLRPWKDKLPSFLIPP